jgi:hypothetical protein
MNEGCNSKHNHLFSLSKARLCVTLAKLGYEGWQQLDVDKFKWPF